MRSVLCLVMSLILTACTHPLDGQSGLVPGAACPPLKHYSRVQQNRLDAELKSCGQGCQALRGALADYHVLRQQVRACRTRR